MNCKAPHELTSVMPIAIHKRLHHKLFYCRSRHAAALHRLRFWKVALTGEDQHCIAPMLILPEFDNKDQYRKLKFEACYDCQRENFLRCLMHRVSWRSARGNH